MSGTVGTAWWYLEGTQFLNNHYKVEPMAQATLRGAELIGIYFGAYSSRGTRLFTKFVKKFHSEIRANTTKFQIIFCSMDDNEKDCQDFVQALHGNWLIIPWADQANRRVARNQCNVSAHPALVVLKNVDEGIVVSVDGKEELQELGADAIERWRELAKNAARKSIESEKKEDTKNEESKKEETKKVETKKEETKKVESKKEETKEEETKNEEIRKNQIN